MKKATFALLTALCLSFAASAADGLINVQSQHSVTTTADRLEKILNKKGMTVFNRISHSKSAAKIGVQLRETELIIFGNPKAGSPLMQCAQKIAIDLPQKTLVYKDENNKVWIAYNDVEYLKNRHSVQSCEKVFLKIAKILATITKLAADK